MGIIHSQTDSYIFTSTYLIHQMQCNYYSLFAYIFIYLFIDWLIYSFINSVVSVETRLYEATEFCHPPWPPPRPRCVGPAPLSAGGRAFKILTKWSVGIFLKSIWGLFVFPSNPKGCTLTSTSTQFCTGNHWSLYKASGSCQKGLRFGPSPLWNIAKTWFGKVSNLEIRRIH